MLRKWRNIMQNKIFMRKSWICFIWRSYGWGNKNKKIFPFLLSSFSFWGIIWCREWCCWKALFIINLLILFSSNLSFKETVLESSIFHGRLIWMVILNSWIKQWINQILIDSCGGKFQWFFFFHLILNWDLFNTNCFLHGGLWIWICNCKVKMVLLIYCSEA